MWAFTIKASLEPLTWATSFLPRTMEKGLGELFAQVRRSWGASLRDVVNSIGEAGSTRPG